MENEAPRSFVFPKTSFCLSPIIAYQLKPYFGTSQKRNNKKILGDAEAGSKSIAKGSEAGDKDSQANKPTQAPPTPAEEAGKIDINFSQGLAGFLAANNISIGFTSYQT